MSGNTVFDVPVVPLLEDLLLDVKRGILRIPRFQRPFVWDDDHRLMLLDSVAKGFSIGSLLVWRTSEPLDCYETLGGYPINSSGQLNSQFNTYIMDGHQRIVTLFTALMVDPDNIPAATTVARRELPGTRHDHRPELPIYVELDKESVELDFPVKGERFHLWRKRGTPPDEWLPLWYLFDEERLDDFKDRRKAAGQRNLANQATALSKRLRKYPIPIVPYFATSRMLVAESYTRLNTYSQRMNELHIVHALKREKRDDSPNTVDNRTEFDLLDAIQQLQDELRMENWGEIEDRLLLNALKIQWKITLHGTDPRVLKANFDNHEQALAELEKDCRIAIDWMRRLGVFHIELLPYTYQLIGFIEVARACGAVITQEQLSVLKRWFWRTSFAESFTGRRENQIRREFEVLVEAVRGATSKPLKSQLGLQIRPISTFQRKWVRSRTMLLLLQERAYPPAKDGFYEAGTTLSVQVELLHRKLPTSHPAAFVMVKSQDELNQLRNIHMPNMFETSEEREQRLALPSRHLISGQAMSALQRLEWSDFLETRLMDIHQLERERMHEVGLEMEAEIVW